MSALSPEQLAAMERFARELAERATPATDSDYSATAIRMLVARVREAEAALALLAERCEALDVVAGSEVAEIAREGLGR